MLFMKKVFLGLGFLLLFSLGGAGTQSNSLIMQGMGFIGLIIGLVILYVFGRMVWKGMGCLPSFLILSAIVLFMMYSLGLFNNGIEGVGQAIMKFIGREKTTVASEQMPNNDTQAAPAEALPENDNTGKFSADFSLKQNNKAAEEPSSPVLFEDTAPKVQKEVVQEEPAESGGLLQTVMSSLSGKKNQQQQKAFNPNDYPVVYGSVRVVNADTLIMYGKYFRLYGIDAPESNQTCANKTGRSYNCGREAALWLKNWIGENELECHVVRQNTKGDMEGTCSYGQYDIGAALVNAGWAVANMNVTDIYYPYEMQARDQRRGLWQGQFYMPWDCRKMQNRKAKIKIISNKKKKNMFGI